MVGRKLRSGTFKTKESRAGLVRASLFLKLRPSIIYSVPCEQIVQRAYYDSIKEFIRVPPHHSTGSRKREAKRLTSHPTT